MKVVFITFLIIGVLYGILLWLVMRSIDKSIQQINKEIDEFDITEEEKKKIRDWIANRFYKRH